MTIETRIATTRAALLDMGRDDLASRVIDADRIRRKYPDRAEPPVSWYNDLSVEAHHDDEILFRRAAAIASLAEGHDEQNYYCEPCVRVRKDPGCTFVTRREFLAHQPCSLHRANPQVSDG